VFTYLCNSAVVKSSNHRAYMVEA